MTMRKKRTYKCLIFDADHTILNYIADEYAAFTRVYEAIGMPIADVLLEDSRRFSEETWTEVGLYEVEDPLVQATYHKVYRTHVTGIFEKVFDKYGNPTSVTAQKAGELFLQELQKKGQTLENAKALLEELSKKYTICIATNGLADIQRGRLTDFEKFARIFVSEELGCIKPLPAFFKQILKRTHISKKYCLMIGDSLRSDIAGAKSVGIVGCWYNPLRRENVSGIATDYEISSLEHLKNILNR